MPEAAIATAAGQVCSQTIVAVQQAYVHQSSLHVANKLCTPEPCPGSQDSPPAVVSASGEDQEHCSTVRIFHIMARSPKDDCGMIKQNHALGLKCHCFFPSSYLPRLLYTTVGTHTGFCSLRFMRMSLWVKHCCPWPSTSHCPTYYPRHIPPSAALSLVLSNCYARPAPRSGEQQEESSDLASCSSVCWKKLIQRVVMR